MATANDRALMNAERQNQNYRDRLKRFNEENKKAIKMVVDSALIGAGSFGFGYVQGRWPDKAQVGGIPASLVVGGGLVAAVAAGLIDDKSGAEYAAALGAGGLACFAALEGLKKGQEASQKA